MSIGKFDRNPTSEVNGMYEGSILSPVAPEYSTGEVLVASAYRRLVLGIHDMSVHLEDISGLPELLVEYSGDQDTKGLLTFWAQMILTVGGLGSPPPQQHGTAKLPQLMPLVPQMARFGGVLGKHGRNRWYPGNLLLSLLASGQQPSHLEVLLAAFIEKLVVTTDDDVLGRFIEAAFERIPNVNTPHAVKPTVDQLSQDALALGPAWRADRTNGHTPSERFCHDLDYVLGLKESLTRRQWTILLEALLRLGMGVHQLWICRLNTKVWSLTQDAFSNLPGSPSDVEDFCWNPQEDEIPFLELGQQADPPFRRLLSQYVESRLGINLILFALEEIGEPWSEKLGMGSESPAAAISRFLNHIHLFRDRISDVLKAQYGNRSLRAIVGALADRYPKLMSGQQGVTRNLLFFLRYSLGQLQPADKHLRPYDQAYVLYRPDQKGDTWMVHLAPAILLLLVHACCEGRRIPASIDDFRQHLAGYGVAASGEQVRKGALIQDLEKLGLVIDSPDAGGGRLLVDPFPTKGEN